MIACPSCGTLNVPGTAQCMRCGIALPVQAQPPQGGGFGAQPPQGGGFGNAPQQGGFGAQSPQSGGFGGQPPQGGGFGNAPQQGGFGAQSPQSGGFGGQPPQGGGYGGQPPQGGGYGAAPAGYGGMPPGAGAQVDVGDVLNSTLAAFKRHFVLLALINVACTLPGWVISTGGSLFQAAQFSSGGVPAMGATMGGMVISIIGALVSMVFHSIALGAASRVGFDDLAGGQTGQTVGTALAFGFGRIATSVGVLFLSGLATFVGVLLCIAPGFIVATMLSVAFPVSVAENKGVMDSLQRSVDVTVGNRTNIFLVYLALVAIAIGITFPLFCCVGVAFGTAGAAGVPTIGAAIVTQLIVLAITVPMTGYYQLLGVTLYQRLTGYGVGTDAGAVAQVFR